MAKETKHLFFLTNNTSKRIAKCYINDKQIDKDRVEIIMTRKVLKEEKSVSYVSDFLSSINFIRDSVNSPYLYRSIKQKKEHINKFIDEKTSGCQFKAYVPHLVHDLFQYISRHENKEQLILVEEGDISYLEKELIFFEYETGLSTIAAYAARYLSSMGSHVARIGTWLPRIDIDKAITVSSRAFDWLPPEKKYVVDVNCVFGEYTKQQSYGNSVIVLADALPCRDDIHGKVYLSKFAEAVEMISHRTSRVFVRFHPFYYQDIECSKKSLKYIRKKIIDKLPNVNECRENMEKLMNPNSDIKIVGLHSSVGRYARMLNIDVYTWSNMIPNRCYKNEKIKNTIKNNRHFQVQVDHMVC